MATITVTRGYNDPTGWTSGETVTPAKLNSAQTPTVAISNIVNADIASGAAIAKSKLAPLDVVNADVNASAAIAYSKLNLSNSIVAGDIASNAVTQAKLATGVAGTGPAFRAYATTNTTVNNTTYTKVTLNVENFDTNNNFASSRFTPTVAGYYHIEGYIAVDGGGTALALAAILYKNSILTKIGTQINTGTYSSTVTDLMYFNGSSDFVELYAWHAAGVAKAMSDSIMTGHLVRAA